MRARVCPWAKMTFAGFMSPTRSRPDRRERWRGCDSAAGCENWWERWANGWRECRRSSAWSGRAGALALCLAAEPTRNSSGLSPIYRTIFRRSGRALSFCCGCSGDLISGSGCIRAGWRAAAAASHRPARRVRAAGDAAPGAHGDAGPASARYLLGGNTVDEAIADTATFTGLSEADTGEPILDPTSLSPGILALKGTDTAKIKRTAAGLAAAAGLQGVLELVLGPTREMSHREIFERAARDSALLEAALLVRGIETLDDIPREAIVTALDSSSSALTIVATPADPPWHGPTVTVERPGVEARLSEWQATLARHELEADVADALPALAAKFELDTGAIAAGVRTAIGLATARGPASARISVDDLYAAARARSAPILSSLASKVTHHKQWEDLILEEDPLAQLQELCAMVEHRHRVYDEWGFGQKLSSGKGVVSLFAGQSGTGKTMGAGVIASALGLDLYKIDLSGVVSKYIGETEKNLGAIFREASLSNAILFFDEADALFGKRSEVRDAHDRYANIETAYLLQQIEEYAGPVILSTNLKMNLDEAFLRRMHFVIDFPMPEEPYRLRIWKTTLPDEVPLGEDVDFGFLRQVPDKRSHIRNIVLAAAFLAANDATN